jgi:hypothetical protein
VVDEGDPADRTQHLRTPASQRAEAGACTGTQHDGCHTVGMEARRWTNPSQPQTLQIAVFLFYINAFFAVLGFGVLSLLVAAGDIGSGFGIANERRWGYNLGLAMAFLPFALTLLYGGGLIGTDLVTLAFEIALIALLLHPQSRDYQRIWFS